MAAGWVAGTSLGYAAPPRRFAYVAAGEAGVHVFSDGGGEWGLVNTVSSAVAAAGVAVASGGRFVYVGHAAGGLKGRPCGWVETFAADGRGGLMTVGRQELALFAKSPERLAISPNGRWLAARVAGGAYNLLPVGEDGLPARVVASVRRLGGKALDGPLRFAGDSLLLSHGDDGTAALAIGDGGALRFVDRVGGSAKGVQAPALDAGLVRALARAGIEARGGIGLSAIAVL